MNFSEGMRSMAMYSSDGVKICDTTNGDIVLPNLEEVEQLKRMADSLEEQVQLAKQEAELAKNDAKKAKRKSFWASLRSWISIGIAAISLFIAFLTNLEKVGLGWQAILQWFSAVLHLN